jgi:hypothetical protein
VAKALDVIEPWGGDGQDGTLVGVAMREGVGHRICGTGLVLDSEVESEELAGPMVLRDRRETLVKKKFEAVVVCAY